MYTTLFGWLLFSATLANGQFGFFPPMPALPSFWPPSGFGGFNNNFSSFSDGFDPFSDDSIGSGFGSFPDLFSSTSNNIQNQIDQQLKPLKVTSARDRMQNGAGGVTIVETGNRVILKKNGVSYRCLGNIANQKPFCRGVLTRLQTRGPTGFCNVDNYYQEGDVLCIANNGQSGLSFSNNNGHYSCYGSDDQPAFMITLADYQRRCGRQPWQKLYHYYPDSLDSLRVPLPDPDLGCQENRPDVCTFQPYTDI